MVNLSGHSKRQNQSGQGSGSRLQPIEALVSPACTFEIRSNSSSTVIYLSGPILIHSTEMGCNAFQPSTRYLLEGVLQQFPVVYFYPGGSTFLPDKGRAPGGDPALGLQRTRPDSATP